MRLILLLLLTLAVSCKKESEETCDKLSLKGTWIWEKSVGGFGGWTLTPESEKTSQKIVIDDLTFTWYHGDSIIIKNQYDYKLSEDVIFGTEEKTYIELADGTNFSVELKDDKLVLIDWCFDCYHHHFHRSK
ncbi:MAG TPA: hypothetical protein PKA12_00390 [Saprospiraceae bacterium]|nr:hypothetical protein [Saprospiraceae bacterium]